MTTAEPLSQVSNESAAAPTDPNGPTGQQDRNYERSRGIWTNLFGGSKKNSEENSEK